MRVKKTNELQKGAEVIRDTLNVALTKRKFTLAILKELRILNPNNLSLVSHSQSDYPILFADRPEISGDWATYCRMPPTNLDRGGHHVQAWWIAQPDSALKHLALFYLRIPFSSGAVERFFSQARVQDDQYSMGDANRRLAFLSRFNGDITGRLA